MTPRYGEAAEDWDYGRWSIWNHSLNRALQGKRGQRALQELKEALEAMPRKELQANSFIREGPCALAAVYVHRKQKELGSSWDDAAEQVLLETVGSICLNCYEPWDSCSCGEPDEGIDSVELGEALNMALTMAWKIVYENDEYTQDPASRWTYIHSWVEARLAGHSVD